MMSLEAIQSLSRDAATRAAEDQRAPFMVHPDDLKAMPPFPFPSVGDYVAPGWERTANSFFVDSSGFGQSGEPALTAREFLAQIKPGYGYAIIEEGQFQVKVAEYKKEKEELDCLANAPEAIENDMELR